VLWKQAGERPNWWLLRRSGVHSHPNGFSRGFLRLLICFAEGLTAIFEEQAYEGVWDKYPLVGESGSRCAAQHLRDLMLSPDMYKSSLESLTNVQQLLESLRTAREGLDRELHE